MSLQLSTLLKYLGLSLLFYLFYLAYRFLLQPYLFWRGYKKYSNVITSEKFVPVIGDLKDHVESVQAGNVHYFHNRAQAKINKNYDLKLKIEGIVPYMFVVSRKALEEFMDLQPSKVDRAPFERGVGKFTYHAFSNSRSTEKTKERRKNFARWLNLNCSSVYIPNMVKAVDRLIGNIKKQDTVPLMSTLNMLTFEIFIEVVFGDDLSTFLSKLHPYENPDGTVEEVDLREMLSRCTKCYVDQYYNPLTSMFPLINKYNLLNPYKRDARNCAKFKDGIRELFLTSKDTKSVGYKLGNSEDLEEFQKLDDLSVLMMAGSETSAHTMVSALYYLQKYPETYKKLMAELVEHGFTKENLGETFTIERVQDLSYLNNVVKEALRMDAPATDTFDYDAVEDITICGVPIPKGTKMKVDIMTAHFDDSKWVNPTEFIPDRHDLDSEFYKKCKEQEVVPDVYSRRAFSHGYRKCPGMSFANLEIKLVIVYLLLQLNFEFEQELIDKEGVGFGLGSHFDPSVKITLK